MRNHAFVVLSLLALLAVPASAGPGVKFDNFPIVGGTDSANPLNLALNIGGSSVSDSFTLGTASTANVVNFGLIMQPGDSITTVDWQIGTGTFGTDVGSGTATVTATLQGIVDELDVYKATFSFPVVSLAAGTTYYLTLDGAAVTSSDIALWDENDGIGLDGAGILAYNSTVGLLSGDATLCDGSNCAESFQIVATPEPSTLALLGSGILAAFALRRKAVRR